MDPMSIPDRRTTIRAWRILHTGHWSGRWSAFCIAPVEFELHFPFCSQPFAFHHTTQTTDHGMDRLTDRPVICMTRKDPTRPSYQTMTVPTVG